MASVRVGFIGVGGKGQSHMQQLQGLDDVQFVAVCDLNGALAQTVGQEYGVPHYVDHHEMLDREDVEALYIVVPPFAHTDAELIAADRGIHLFVEKPVVLELAKGLEILKAVERAGIITSVGYQMRYMEPTIWAREFVGSRQVTMISVHRWGGAPGKAWWRRMGQSGGQLVEQTTHQVDAVRYVSGDEIVRVRAEYGQRVFTGDASFDIPDTYVVGFEMGNGAIGSLTSACTMVRGGGESGMDLLLADGLRLELSGRNVRVHPDVVDVPEFDTTAPIDSAFIEAIRTGDQSLIRSDYRDGLVSCAVTLAANESAQTGQPVVPRFAQSSQ